MLTSEMTPAKLIVTSTKYAPRSLSARRPMAQPAKPAVTAALGRASQKRPVELEREQRRGVGADPEEGGMAERELARVAQQQVETEGEDREDAGHDQHVQVIGAHQPRRRRDQRQRGHGQEHANDHPTRSARANSPAGRKSSTRMMATNPTASR